MQTWQLLPVQPATSDLMAAYDDREVVEFSGAVFGSDDDPSRQPHRRYLIREAAEGITVTLDYQGDPPPLAVGPRYRFVAWADFVPPPAKPLTATVTPTPVNQLPDAASYELQVHDSIGLLFLGLTDTDLADDPLGIEVSDAEGDCPAVVITNNPCVETRQVQPLRIRWGDDEITLYPGEDGQLATPGHDLRCVGVSQPPGDLCGAGLCRLQRAQAFPASSIASIRRRLCRRRPNR